MKLPFRQKIEVNHRLLEGFIVLKLESTKCECRSFAFLLKHGWKKNFWQQFSSSGKNYYVVCLNRVSYTILPLNTSKQNYMLGKIWVLSKPLTFVNRNIFCDSFENFVLYPFFQEFQFLKIKFPKLHLANMIWQKILPLNFHKESLPFRKLVCFISHCSFLTCSSTTKRRTVWYGTPIKYSFSQILNWLPL